jgi:hypothetical protein
LYICGKFNYLFNKKMALKNYSLIGVLNTNPSVAADVAIANGELSVQDTTVTVGSLSWGGVIKWVDITDNTVTASSAGVFSVKEFNTAAVVPTASTQYTVRIFPDPASGINPSTYIYNTGTVAPSIAALVTALAVQITATSQGTYTATNVANDLRIQGNLGTLNQEVYDFNMSISLAVTQTVVTALVQPNGTPSVINANTGIPLANLTAATYNTYEVAYTEKVQNAAGTFEVFNREAVVYVDDTADILFAGSWAGIFGGTAFAVDYLARP